MNRDDADAQYQNVAYEFDSGLGYPQPEYEPKITGMMPPNENPSANNAEGGSWFSRCCTSLTNFFRGGRITPISETGSIDILHSNHHEHRYGMQNEMVGERLFPIGTRPLRRPEGETFWGSSQGEGIPGHLSENSHHHHSSSGASIQENLPENSSNHGPSSMDLPENSNHSHLSVNAPEPFRAGKSDFSGSGTLITVTELNQLAQAMASVNASVGAVMTSTGSFIGNPGTAKPLTLAPNMVH